MKKKFGMFDREVVIYPDRVVFFNYPRDNKEFMYILVTTPAEKSMRKLLDVLETKKYPCSPVMNEEGIIRYIFQCGASKRK